MCKCPPPDSLWTSENADISHWALALGGVVSPIIFVIPRSMHLTRPKVCYTGVAIGSWLLTISVAVLNNASENGPALQSDAPSPSGDGAGYRRTFATHGYLYTWYLVPLNAITGPTARNVCYTWVSKY
jgi:hypothetical protein